MQDGPSQVRWSVVDSRRRTLEKKMETLRKGSLIIMTVMQDGPSWVRRSVTCVRWNRVLWLLERTLRQSVVGTTVCQCGLVLNDKDKTVDTLSNLDESTWSCSVVDLYVSIPTT